MAGANTVLQGMTAEEAARRLAADGPNELPAGMRRNLVRELWDVIRQPMLLLLLGAGLVNFLLAEPLDGGLVDGVRRGGHRDLGLSGAQDRASARRAA